MSDLIQVDHDAVKGALPDSMFKLIEWDRVSIFVAQAIERQEPEVRDEMRARFTQLSLDMRPFDESWNSEIRVNGLPFIRLHVYDLLRISPLTLDSPLEPKEAGVNPGGYL